MPAGLRKVILATNIAESSITFDDVVAVIDSCRVNVATFDSVNNMPRLGPQVRRQVTPFITASFVKSPFCAGETVNWQLLHAVVKHSDAGSAGCLPDPVGQSASEMAVLLYLSAGHM